MANNFRATSDTVLGSFFFVGVLHADQQREGDDSRCGSTSYEREKGRADLSKEYNFRKWNLVPEIWLLFLLE